MTPNGKPNSVKKLLKPLKKSTVNPATPQNVAGSNLGVIDIASLRLSQDFSGANETKEATATIRVRKPAKEWFVRTHPEDSFWFETMLLELKEVGEHFLVAKPVQDELADEPMLVAKLLVPTINTLGSIVLWPIKLPRGGRIDSWNASARTLATQARSSWLRVIPDQAMGGYRGVMAGNVLPDALWPSSSINDLLQAAFRDHYIDSIDHPVLRKLRGEE